VTLKLEEDAYGRAMLDYLAGRGGYEIVEREDGYISIGAGPAVYFSAFQDWRQVERDAMAHVTGRVLDIGCGAGRFMLWLRDRGHDVVGIETSPGAVETCRRRGLTEVHAMSLSEVSNRLGMFDTFLLLGGNLGLLGDRAEATRLLGLLGQVASPGAKLIGASRDWTTSEDAFLVERVAANVKQGRISGQSRLRIRYRSFATPFFDFFRIAPNELGDLVHGTPWVVSDIIDRQEGLYVAVFRRS
jgi:SAM-dependent methyltransferase